MKLNRFTAVEACTLLTPTPFSVRGEAENLDGGKETRTGRELVEAGFTVTLGEKPAAAVLDYRRVKKGAGNGSF